MKNNSSIKNNLLKQIKTGELQMRSRWIFIAKKLGLESGFVFLIITIIFLINAFLYYIKSNNILMNWHYGSSTWQEILHSLPYDLILVLIILFLIFNLTIKKFDFVYKKPFALILAISISVIIFFTLSLFASNFNYTLKNNLEKNNSNLPIISDFYLRRCGCINERENYCER